MTHAARIRWKFLLRRLVGEPYVGKRMKMRHLDRLLASLPLPVSPRLMEVGSGDGVFCHWLARTWPDAVVRGIDKSHDEVMACEAWAMQAGLSNRLSFGQCDVLDLAEQQTADLIICLDVLEYVRDDHRAMANMVAALKPGGWLVVHGPNVTYQRFLLESAGLEAKDVRTLHGRLTDLAFTVYHALEEPAALRLLSLPIVDALAWIDRRIMERVDPGRHGNTVFALARRPVATVAEA